jgi:predicted metal-dependent hydrolase
LPAPPPATIFPLQVKIDEEPIDESIKPLRIQLMDDLQPETLSLPLGLARVEWRRNSRARRVSLRIDPTGGAVVVTLPTRATRKAGMALLMGHAEWVSNRLAALPEAVAFVEGATVPIGGMPHRICHAPAARGGAFLLDQELHVTGALEFLSRRVRDFLRQEARRRLGALVAAKAGLIGEMPKRITVKDTTSRWGSCSSDKSLALSWRLVMAPAFVQDYVVAHEVAHLRHMNHGPKFWSLVDELTPHTRAAIPWLRMEGPRLLRIG